jgi:hypothetical protein
MTVYVIVQLKTTDRAAYDLSGSKGRRARHDPAGAGIFFGLK